MGLFDFLGDAVSKVGTAIDYVAPGSPAEYLGGVVSGTPGGISEAISSLDNTTSNTGATQLSTGTFVMDGIIYNSAGDPIGTVNPDSTTSGITGGTSLGGTSGGTINTASANDLAYLDQQQGLLQAMLGRTDTSLAQGQQRLGNSYISSRDNATSIQNKQLRDYGIQRTDMTDAKTGALGTVDTNARTLANSLRRILGMASGSGSSAYQLAAPSAVARQASNQRQGVMDTYGRNERNIDTSQEDAVISFEKLLGDLQKQRNEKEQELQSGVQASRDSINQNLMSVAQNRALVNGTDYAGTMAAQQPYANAINEGQSRLDQIFAKYNAPITSAPIAYKAPELSGYTVNKAGINQGGQTNQVDYSTFLKKKLQESL